MFDVVTLHTEQLRDRVASVTQRPSMLRGQHLESAHEIAVLGPKRVQFGPVVGRHGEEYSRGCLLMITFYQCVQLELIRD